MSLPAYKRLFLSYAVEQGLLSFGRFTLKSGRVSPYFFNMGGFFSAAAMAQLGSAYAAAINASGIRFDGLFGPAYKAIPLVTATALALHLEQGRDVPFCFDRKEAKQHGESGHLVGTLTADRLLIIDDVLTAGTALRASLQRLGSAAARCVGLVVAFDRQERGLAGNRSAVQEIEVETGMPVVCITALKDLLQYLEEIEQDEEISAIRRYHARYGV